MLNYVSTRPLKVNVDGKYPEGIEHIPITESDWIRVHVPIYDQGISSVTWSNHFGFRTGEGLFYDSGIIDQLSLSADPVISFGPFDHSVSLGKISDPLFSFIAIGERVKHQLLYDGKVMEEKTNRPITFETLQLGDDGTYQIKITNELGGTVTSDPFEIKVAAIIEKAVD